MSFFFEEDIITWGVFEIFFSVGRDEIVEDEDIDPEQVASIAYRYEKDRAQKDSLEHSLISSFHK